MDGVCKACSTLGPSYFGPPGFKAAPCIMCPMNLPANATGTGCISECGSICMSVHELGG